MKMNTWELICRLDDQDWTCCAWADALGPGGRPLPYRAGEPKTWFVKADARTLPRLYLCCLLEASVLLEHVDEIPHGRANTYYEALLQQAGLLPQDAAGPPGRGRRRRRAGDEDAADIIFQSEDEGPNEEARRRENGKMYVRLLLPLEGPALLCAQ